MGASGHLRLPGQPLADCSGPGPCRGTPAPQVRSARSASRSRSPDPASRSLPCRPPAPGWTITAVRDEEAGQPVGPDPVRADRRVTRTGSRGLDAADGGDGAERAQAHKVSIGGVGGAPGGKVAVGDAIWAERGEQGEPGAGPVDGGQGRQRLVQPPARQWWVRAVPPGDSCEDQVQGPVRWATPETRWQERIPWIARSPDPPPQTLRSATPITPAAITRTGSLSRNLSRQR